MVKKYILLMFSFLLLFTSANAVEYLNSCGKTTGWTTTETYIINFTEIPNTATSPCFVVDTSVDNLTFDGENRIINNLKDGLVFISITGAGNSDYWNLKDFTMIDNSSAGASIFVQTNLLSASSINLRYWTVDNIKLKAGIGNSFNYIWYGRYYGNSHSDYNYMNITNSWLESGYAYYSSQITTNNFDGYFNGNIIDSVLIINNMMFRNQGCLASGNKVNDSVLIIGDHSYDCGSQVAYNGNLMKDYPHVDSNNDNLADGNLYTGITNAVISRTLFGYDFIQDINEGLTFSSSSNINVPLETEDIGGGNLLPLGNNQVFDLSFVEYNFSSNFFNIQLSGSNSNLQCNFYSYDSLNDRCSIHNSDSTTTTTGTLFRPNIGISQTNHIISDIGFVHDGLSNSNLIANLLDNQYSGLELYNTQMYTYYPTQGGSATESNNLIKLRMTNLNIHDNYFESVIGSVSDVFETLYIDSTNPTSNKIYNNDFQISGVIPTSPTEIFTYQCDTNFYDNNVGTDIVVSNSCTDVNVNPVVGYYNSGDGKYYYYTLGNYYEDNTGCIDGDSDGFCDSSYLSGGVNDTHPLSSYPFDFSSHLFTADFIVTAGAYNITLLDINESETVFLNSASDSLIFSFSHSSDYPNLVCDYLIDGGSVGQEISPIKNTQYNSSGVTGWTTKSYTYRVECYNDEEGYVSSPELNFNVIVAGQTLVCGNAILEAGEGCDDGNTLNGDGCSSTCQIEGGGGAICGNGIWEFTETCDDGNLIDGDGCSSTCQAEVTETGGAGNYYGGAGDIIDSDIGTTSDNVVGFFKELTNGGLSIIIPVGLFLFVMLMIGGTMLLIR